MSDATYNSPIDDPVVSLAFRGISIHAGPPPECSIGFIQKRQSGALGETINITVRGPRAQSFLAAWAQANPIRKMIADLRAGGELPGVTET